MKIKIVKPNGVVIEAVGSAEELAKVFTLLVLQEIGNTYPTVYIPSMWTSDPSPAPYTITTLDDGAKVGSGG